jgi:hypothetical protein
MPVRLRVQKLIEPIRRNLIGVKIEACRAGPGYLALSGQDQRALPHAARQRSVYVLDIDLILGQYQICGLNVQGTLQAADLGTNRAQLNCSIWFWQGKAPPISRKVQIDFGWPVGGRLR